MTLHKIVLNCLLPSVTETEFPLYDIKQSSDENNKIKDLLVDPTLYSLK